MEEVILALLDRLKWVLGLDFHAQAARAGEQRNHEADRAVTTMFVRGNVGVTYGWYLTPQELEREREEMRLIHFK